jgi:mono/diheme cytochrome c family protein
VRATRRVPLLAATLGALCLLGIHALARAGEEDPPRRPDPARGYRLLLEKAYLPPTFDQETFDALWRVWPEPLRAEAERATPERRRELAFARYGLTPRPGDASGRPLQYVVDEAGRWSMNCFACHGGELAGVVRPGLPNTRFAFQTLAEDVERAKRLLGKPLLPSDLSHRLFPLGRTNGTTNAVMFSVALLSFRDEDLHLVTPAEPPRFEHHDLDAPPWWNVRFRRQLYIDGFAPKRARALMQFTLVPQTGPEQLQAWEPDFEDILAWIETLEPPPWPYALDRALAERGRRVFEAACAACHGTYGERPTYPGRAVPIAAIGTDPVRHEAIREEQRERYARSWFTGHDPTGVVTEPVGYVAPPLHGVWASAPYFHNGAVPTLWHVLHPAERPRFWRRAGEEVDVERVGLSVDVLERVDPSIPEGWERRAIFDTTLKGKSAAGHLFPDRLTEPEKRAVLEYLKTL